MTRPLTLAMANRLKDGAPFVLFAEIDHPDGTAYFWTGLGGISWSGQTWTGAGTFGAVTPIKLSTDIAIQEINFILSGVDATELAKLSTDVRNRSGRAWIACLDDHGQVVPDPFLFVDSQLDYQTLSVADDGMSASISITARMGFYTLERGIDEAWTPERHKLEFPGDIGLDMIPGLQNQDVLWTPS